MGDQPAWARPDLDDSSWPLVDLPTGWGRRSPKGELAWYRRRVAIAPRALRQPPGLAILVGNVDSAYEIYADGVRLGGVGALPPEPRIDYDRHGLYVIPPEAGRDESLVIALRVWKSPDTESSVGGPVEGPLRLGPTLELERHAARLDMLRLFLGGLFVLVGLYHLQIFRQRPTQREYLWYAGIAVCVGVYSFLGTQWKYVVTDRFLILKELEYAVMMILPALFIEFLFPLLGRPLTRLLRAYQVWTVGLALLVSLTPGLWLNLHALPAWEVSLVLLVVATLAVLARETWRGHPEARTLAGGLSVFLLLALHDVAVDRGLVTTPRLASFGFATFVLSMAVSLANRFGRAQAELATLHRELEQRVEERTVELAQKTAEAAAASEAKSRFLATISHEIRTPLNAVIGMTGLVMDTPLSPHQRESLEIVRRSGEGLLEQLDDVLDFSRIESDRMVLVSEPFSPRGCVEGTLDLLAASAAVKQLDLAGVVAPEVPARVTGDARRVRQLLLNLVGNAIKFTASGGVLVRVSPWRDGDGREGLHVSVADTGPGIPPELRGKLFEPFSQLDTALTRQHGGAGLGLAISRRLSELMGGRVWVGDEPGPGAVFHFAFPASAAPHQDPLPEDGAAALGGKRALLVGARPFTKMAIEACLAAWRMEVEAAGSVAEADERLRAGRVDVVLADLDEVGSSTAAAAAVADGAPRPPWVGFGHSARAAAPLPTLATRVAIPIRAGLLRAALLEALGEAPASGPASAPRAPARPRPLRILLAEDNVVNQRVALGLLRREGYTADVAANGLEALEALRRHPYDVVLLDVQMPELDGLETARRIRQEWAPGPWLIAVTASALHGDREACLAAGMDDYLAKPFRAKALADALSRCPASRESAPEAPGGASGDAFEDLVGAFLREADAHLAAMRAAAGDGDVAALRRRLHSLKGSAGLLGATALEAACAALEHALREGASADVTAHLERMSAELEAVRSNPPVEPWGR